MVTNSIAVYNLEILKQLPISYTNLSVVDYSIEVLHTYTEAPEKEFPYVPYYFKGIVKEGDIPVSRELVAYSQDTYNEVGRTKSNLDGVFVLPSSTSSTCFIVCLGEDSIDKSHNHLIVAIVNPLEINN